MAEFDTLWINAHLATMARAANDFETIRDGAIGARDGTIAFVGPHGALPGPPEVLADVVVDARGTWVTPGLVDPHTHLVFGGDRLRDFERRIAGETYRDATGAEKGIAHTVAMTRAASADVLYAGARARLDALVANGATTVEIKSGYGLDLATELRMLGIARAIGRDRGVSVRTTYLGAHVVPPEFANDRGTYLDLVCDVVLPRVAREGLADAVDVFCDAIAFSPGETERVFAAAERLGLPVKMHADQLTDCGGAELAARHHALSADHLEFASESGIEALAASGTVAVLLPGAYYVLQENRKPPLAALRARGVSIALATDCNPGTSPVSSLPLAMNLGCVLFGLTPQEALLATTRFAARALGLVDRGELRVGLRCDLAFWNVAEIAELCYWMGRPLCTGVVVGGVPI